MVINNILTRYVKSLIGEATIRVQATTMLHCEQADEVPPPLCSNFHHPDKAEAIAAQITRFRRNWIHGKCHLPLDRYFLWSWQHMLEVKLGFPYPTIPSTILWAVYIQCCHASNIKLLNFKVINNEDYVIIIIQCKKYV